MDKPPSLKPLYWVGSSKRDLAVPARPGGGPLWRCSLPRPGWQEARAGQASQRLRLRWCAGGCRGLGPEYVSSRVHRTVRGRGVRAAYVPKEVQARSGHTQGRYRSDPRASQGRGAVRQGDIAMKKQRVVRGIPVEEGSGNVFTDLGYRDSESMLVKAQLAAKIAEILKRRALTQARAAEILGLTQPKVSDLLKGRFRGISEQRLLECLTRLGRDVHIVIKPTPRSRPNGRLTLSVA